MTIRKSKSLLEGLTARINRVEDEAVSNWNKPEDFAQEYKNHYLHSAIDDALHLPARAQELANPPHAMINPEISSVGRRRLLWRICLAQLPPDERDRVLAEPGGQEALSLAVVVELYAQEDPAKFSALLADPGNEIRTACDYE